MPQKSNDMLRQLITVFFGSRRATIVSALFIVAVMILLYAVYHEVKESVRIDLLIGREKEQASGLTLSGPTEILVLNSYHVGQTFSDNEMKGIIDVFQKASPKIQPRVEYLDTKYFPKTEHFEQLKKLFVHKYRTKKVPIVIVTDDPALDFALKYQSQIFPDAALVFCGINGYTPQRIAGHANITGIAEILNADETLNAALTLHPKTRTVFIIHDYTTTGLATRREAEEQLAGMAGRVEFRFAENMTKKELTGFLKQLPVDSIVLPLSYSVFKDGEVINHKNIARLLSENSPVPVYGLHEERLGHGIVGGSLLGGQLHGANAAELAIRILSGEPASNIPVMLKAPTRMMFDHTQIERFHIDESLLPKDSVIVNRPIPFIERHLYLFVSTLLVVAILISGIIALGLNVVQRVRAQETIQKQVLELETKNAELERFTYTVSHDLKSPLITIKGFLGMLVSDAKTGKFDRMESDIKRIENAASKMQSLLDDLLELSRIGRIVNPPSEFSMTALAREAAELVHGSVQIAAVEVVIDPDMPKVSADRQRIREVLQNLIENALKFKDDRVASRIEIGCRVQDGSDIFFVKDNGMGIESKFQKKIFGLFDKLDPASSGTGIGLALVKRIVELHNGRIWVESEGSGKGSTFCFTLPARKETEKKAA
jgi:signal transduction histidine kinase